MTVTLLPITCADCGVDVPRGHGRHRHPVCQVKRAKERDRLRHKATAKRRYRAGKLSALRELRALLAAGGAS